MADKDTGQERTEEPTQKRQQDAKRKGQVPRSRELNTLVMMLASAGGMLMLGETLASGLVELVRAGLNIEPAQVFAVDAPVRQLMTTIRAGVLLLLPFFGLMLVAALLGPLVMGGGGFSAQAMAPKFSKLNPIKGLGRIFSLKGLMELTKALGKFLLIGGVGVYLLWHQRAAFLGLGAESLQPALVHATHLLGWAFLYLATSLIAIVALDVPFQLWDHRRNLRMTRQEVKEEMKNTEGRPEVKGRIRQMQREISMRRMMEEVPKADVVVTNPTHFAVALQYDPDTMSAPRVVAKGADVIAAQIRSLATSRQVPLLEAPLLARALYYSTEIDHEIPSGLYLAVAQVLGYIFQLRTARQEGGLPPTPPRDVPVPGDFYTGPK